MKANCELRYIAALILIYEQLKNGSIFFWQDEKAGILNLNLQRRI
jgi:hypothetical protein